MPRFEASSDTRFLTQTLAKAKPGDLITYQQLSEAIGRDVRKHARGSLMSAVRCLIADGYVFEAVPNEGYRRLTDSEIVKTQAAKGLAHISKTARRTARKVGAAQVASLNSEERTSQLTQLSMLGAVGHLTKPASLTKLETKVRAKSDELAIGETLALMTK